MMKRTHHYYYWSYYVHPTTCNPSRYHDDDYVDKSNSTEKNSNRHGVRGDKAPVQKRNAATTGLFQTFDENGDSHPVPDRDATVIAQQLMDGARRSLRTRKVSQGGGGGGQQDQIVVATEQEPKKLPGVALRTSRPTQKALVAVKEIDDAAKSMDGNNDDDDSNNGMTRRDGSGGNVPKTSNTAEATAAATAEMLGIKEYDSSSSSDDDGGTTSGSDKDLDALNAAAAKAKTTTAPVDMDGAIGHGAAKMKEVVDVDGDKNGTFTAFDT